MTQQSDNTQFSKGSYSAQKAEELKQMLKGDHEKKQPKTELNSENSQPSLAEADLALQENEAQIESLKSELETTKKELQDAHLRHLADLENTRRRLQRDRDEVLKYGNEALLKELLHTVDNLERTLEHIAPGEMHKNLRDGIELVLKQLTTTLHQFGVKEIDARGLLFDPHLHEAIASRAEDGTPSHTVLDVHQKGYQYYDRLLRPARVTISD